MSEEHKSDSSLGTAAESYVDEHLENTRKSFNTTRVVSIVLIVFVALYMGFITSKLKSAAEPENVADLLVGYGESLLNERGPDLTKWGLDQIHPLVSEELPKMIMGQIPRLTSSLEKQEGNFTTQFIDQTRPIIGSIIDRFLVKNKGKVKEYFAKMKQFKEATDPAEIERLKKEKEDMMTELSNTFWSDLESVSQSEEFQKNLKAASFQASIKQMRVINEDLAIFVQQDDQLSPEDKDLRFGIAMILSKLNWGDKESFGVENDKDPEK